MSQLASCRSMRLIVAWVVLVGRRVFGNSLPALTIIKLHPIIFPILYLSGILQCLSEEVSKQVVIGCILEPEVPYVAQVLVKLV